MAGNYFFRGRNEKGEKVKGNISASSREEAAFILGERGILITGLKAVREEKKFFSPVRSGLKELVFFARQLSALLDTGVSLSDSLNLLAEQMQGGKWESVILGIRDRVLQGNSLYEALSSYPRIFPPFFRQMVRIGEEGGVIAPALSRSAIYLEKEMEMKQELRNSLRYPLFVLAVAGGVILFLIFSVLPQFASMYHDLGQDLPGVTAAILRLNDFSQAYTDIFLGFLLIIIILGWRLSKTRQGKLIFRKIQGRFAIFQKIWMEDFARNLGLLLQAGLPLDSSLKIILEQMENRWLKKKMGRVLQSIQAGESLGKSLQREVEFFHPLGSMLEIGEETGQIGEFAEHVARQCRQEVEISIKGMVGIIEPVLIVLLAGVVGMVIIGLILPMLDMIHIW